MSDDVLGAINLLGLNVTETHFNKGVRYANETLGYWYRQLSEPIKESLRQIYRKDFEIFGFDDAVPT